MMGIDETLNMNSPNLGIAKRKEGELWIVCDARSQLFQFFFVISPAEVFRCSVYHAIP